MKAYTAPAFKPVVVLRFHEQFAVVRQRIELIKGLNPGVPLYALYGGSEAVPEDIVDQFDGFCRLELLPELAFRNVDLALIEWYRSVGHAVEFSHAYILEWDLIYVAPITTIMPIPRPAQSMLTGYTPMAKVEWKWDFTNGKKLGPLNEWLELKRFVAERHRFIGPYYACIGPGAVLSREFFEYYQRLELPLLCHDEIRLPMVHSLGRLTVGDTGFYPPSWYLPEHEAWIRRFNVRRWEVEPRMITPGVREGVMAYHPVRKLIDQRLIQRLISKYNRGVSAPHVTGS